MKKDPVPAETWDTAGRGHGANQQARTRRMTCLRVEVY